MPPPPSSVSIVEAWRCHLVWVVVWCVHSYCKPTWREVLRGKVGAGSGRGVGEEWGAGSGERGAGGERWLGAMIRRHGGGGRLYGSTAPRLYGSTAPRPCGSALPTVSDPRVPRPVLRLWQRRPTDLPPNRLGLKGGVVCQGGGGSGGEGGGGGEGEWRWGG